MWPEEDEDVASSFASSQSRSVDSTSNGQPHYEQRGRREAQEDSDEDAYDDEDFEGYSDEFESDDEEASTSPGDSMDTTGHDESVWKAGDRVQVYWEEEHAWFDGVVGRVERTRCFVQYADGEQQWEEHKILRVAPPVHANGADQLQQLHGDSAVSTLVGRRVVVYWQDERDWFEGRIDDARVATGDDHIHVVYDDGDDQWLSATTFRDVLVLPLASKLEDPISESTDCTTGRVLTPRPYIPAVEHHFEPIRVARQYKATVPNHLGSIITPRSWDRRLFYHPRVVAQLDCVPQLPTSTRYSIANDSRDCHVQTEISVESEPTTSA